MNGGMKNQVALANKYVRLIYGCWEKDEGGRGAIRKSVEGLLGRMWERGGVGVEMAVGAKEMPKVMDEIGRWETLGDGMLNAFMNDGIVTETVGGVTTVYPPDWEPSVEGDMGEAEREIEPVAPEWPSPAMVMVGKACVNPKVMSGVLEDGRSVSVEKGWRNWRRGEAVECELVRGGGSPCYKEIGKKL